MSPPPPAPPGRMVFLDNLRYFFVLCVVMVHAALGYAGLSWMPVADPHVSLAAQMMCIFFDTCMMPVIFLVAGYFAVPSLRKRSAGAFMMGKIKRLGLPWLVCILTVCPSIALFYQATRKGLAETAGFWDIWQEYLVDALSFPFGVVPSMNQLMESNGYTQHYMWFLSFLIVVNCLFAGVYALKKDWFAPRERSLDAVPQGARPTIILLVIVALSTALPNMAVIGFIRFFLPQVTDMEPMMRLSPFIQIQPTRLIYYVFYFGLGVLAFRNDWFARGRFPGDLRTWLVSFPLLTVALFATYYMLEYGPRDMKPFFAAAVFLFQSFVGATVVFMSMALAMRWWNRPRQFDQDLTAHSYNIYIAHYIFVIGLQAAFLQVPGLASLWKIAIITVAGIVLGYATSRFLITPHPRITSATAFGLLIISFLVF